MASQGRVVKPSHQNVGILVPRGHYPGIERLAVVAQFFSHVDDVVVVKLFPLAIVFAVGIFIVVEVTRRQGYRQEQNEKR